MDEVLAELERRVRTNPGDREAWLKLARSYERLGRDAEAYLAYLDAQAEPPTALSEQLASAQREAMIGVPRPKDATYAVQRRESRSWKWLGFGPFLGPVLALDLRFAFREMCPETFAFLGQLGTLTDLHLDGRMDPGLVAPGLEQLRLLPALRKLMLLRRIGDAELEVLAGFPALHELKMPGSPLSSAGLATLARFPELRRLDLSGSSLRGRELVPLGELTRLERLGFRGYDSLGEVGLAAIARLTRLTHLNLRSTNQVQVSAEALRLLADVRGLRELQLDYRSAPGFVAYDQWPELTRLSLSFHELSREALARIGRLQHLVELDLSGCSYEAGDLVGLNGLPRLELLDLTYAKFEAMPRLELPALKKLTLPGEHHHAPPVRRSVHQYEDDDEFFDD